MFHHAVLACLVLLALGGCGGNDNTPFVKDVNAVAIDGVASAAIDDLGTLQLSCRVYYSDGSSADATQHLSWSSSAGNVASVSAGTVSRVSADGAEVNITVAFEQYSDYVTVNVHALGDINVTTADVNVSVNSSYQLTATGIFTDTLLDVNSSADITAGVTWSSSDTAVATVDAAGLLTTLGGGGAVTIMAKSFDVNGTIDMNVAP